MNKDKLRLKVCGMCDASNIVLVGALGPDYMGFIFYRTSRRFVGDDFTIPGGLPTTIKRVGVFVNDSSKTVLDCARKHNLDFIQLHGEESVSQCEELRAAGLKVIKAFGIDGGTDLRNFVPYKGSVDFFLFDTKGNGFGGTGKTFDWNVLARYDQEVPFFLSGGLSPDNVGAVAALGKMNLHALDVNSGIEISAGIKDVEKLKVFMDRIPV